MTETPREIVLANLLQVLGNPDLSLSARELRALSGLDSTDREQFWGAWHKIESERRVEIAHTMIDLAEDNVDLDFREVWHWLLQDSDARVRAAALEGMWEDESLRAMRRTIELLRNDAAGEVRSAAAIALSRFAHLAALGDLESGEEQLERALLDAIFDEQQPLDVRRRALESAGYFSDSDAVQSQIDAAYRSADQFMRESAVMAMGRSMLPRWLSIIQQELESNSPALRYEAARAAGEFADLGRPLLPKLLKLLDDSDTEIAVAAIWALGQIGGDAARRALQRYSRSSDVTRAEAATEALQELDLGDLPQ